MVLEKRTFGDTVKLLRKEQKLTQGELGELLGLSPSAIGSYERNTREPVYANLIDLANTFRVSVDYLVGATDERFTVKDFIANEKYDLMEILEKFTVTIQDRIMTEDEKHRIYDMAVGMLWNKLSE